MKARRRYERRTSDQTAARYLEMRSRRHAQPSRPTLSACILSVSQGAYVRLAAAAEARGTTITALFDAVMAGGEASWKDSVLHMAAATSDPSVSVTPATHAKLAAIAAEREIPISWVLDSVLGPESEWPAVAARIRGDAPEALAS